MSKLVVKVDGVQAEIIELRTGLNKFGRTPENDFVLAHPSISSAHCEIYLEEGAFFVRDLNSTNGTFIDGERISESFLTVGQTLRLGSVELSFAKFGEAQQREDAVASVGSSKLRVAKVEPTSVSPFQSGVSPVMTSVDRHPSFTPAFHSGGFFANLPKAFAYPLKRDGLTILIAGTTVFAFLEFLQMAAQFVLGGIFGFLVFFWLGGLIFGYMAAFMQKIITTSAEGDEDIPQWPEFSDYSSSILHPAILVAGSVAASFGPAILFYWFAEIDPTLKSAIGLGLVFFGCLYLPMALIATAIYDSLLAVMPLLIVPSILRALKEYLVVCVVLALVIGIKALTEFLLNWMLPIPLVPTVLSIFVTLYFVILEMRILGIFYYCKKQDLGWSF